MAAPSVEKLNAKGMLAWRVDGVLARLTRKQSADAGHSAQIKPLVGMGAALLGGIKERVQEHGRLGEGDVFRGYSTRTKALLSVPYAGHAGVDRTFYPSVQKFHQAAGTVLGSFSASGGMWEGPQARGVGRNECRLDFAGTSEARGVPVFAASGEMVRTRNRSKMPAPRFKPGAGRLVAIKAGKVQNRFKAGAIEDKTGVHVLRPTVREELACQEAVVAAVHLQLAWVTSDGSRLPVVQLGGDAHTRRRILALWG